MASNLEALASTLLVMASTLLAMASDLEAMTLMICTFQGKKPSETKKLLGTSASLLGASAFLVVTRSY